MKIIFTGVPLPGAGDSLSKLLLAMKLTTLLLLVACIQVSAHVEAQTVTYSKNNVSLEKVFKTIRQQTGYEFLYNTAMLEKTKRVDLSFYHTPLREVLDEIFRDEPFTYGIVDKTIVVRRKESVREPAPAEVFLSRIGGTVSDSATGDPLVGVTIRVKGSTMGTTTDANGKFSLDVPDDAVLEVSYVGYNSKEIPVRGRSSVSISLGASAMGLNQLVVIGYGTTTKKDLTGAVSSINVENLKNENPTSVQAALRANIPGLNVGFSTGAKPGGSLQIRGVNSLTAGTSPLIVIDGVIYYGSLSDINPQDIATVDVLKGASAAAVYGAKAANGVIVITTKRGIEGKPVINFNANFSLATMEVNQPVYQGEDFVNWRTEVENSMHGFNQKPYQFNDPRKLPSEVSLDQWLAYDNSSGDPVTVWLQRLNLKPIEITNYKNGAFTNWYDMVFQNGVQQNYTLSLSGASDKFNYYWSGGYLNNEGIIVGDKYSTIQSRLKIEGKVTKFLKVGINTAFSNRDESSVPVNWGLIVSNDPTGGMWNDDTTDYRFSPQDDPGVGARNPYYRPKYTDRLKRFQTLNSIIYGEVTLPFGITYTLNFSPEFEWYQYFNHNSSEDQDFTLLGGQAEREQHQIYQWQLDNIIHWNRRFNDHNLQVTLLANAQKYSYWQNNMQTSGFDPTDILGYHNFASGSTPAITTDDQYSTQAALMARIFYSYKERYLLTLSVRRDGNSAFGQKYPWSTFPAIAAGWIFTEEPFFEADWLDYGKLRFSYGINGNSSIGRYSALSNLTTGKYLEVNPDGTVNVVSELWVDRMQNKDLKWERTAAFNLGLDFSIAHNILSGTIEAYKSKTTNLLVDRTLPDVSGFTNIATNLGQVDNKGLEITLNSHNIDRHNFSWGSSFNFSLNRNKIVHLYGTKVNIVDSTGKVIGEEEASDITNRWFIGHPIDAIWDAQVVGVYQTDEAGEAAKYGKFPGDFKVADLNGDGKITNEDRQFLGYTEPRFRWSIKNNFTFHRNLDLSFMIYSYWGQTDVFNQAANEDRLADRRNMYVFPYWTPENGENNFARLVSNNGGSAYNVYRKRSFIRLGNASLAYTFPKRFLHKADIQNFRIYFTMSNVAFYAPDWIFWDPENSGPTPRTYTLGLDLTL